MNGDWMGRIATLLPLVAAPAAMADEFTDFRIPAHRVTDWTAGLDASAYRSVFSSSGLDNRVRTAGGGARSSWRWLSDSDPASTSAAVEALASGGAQWRSQDFFSVPPLGNTFAGEDRSLFERWRVTLAHRRYPWSSPLGFSMSLTGLGDYQQSWRHDELLSLQDDGVNLTESVSRSREQRWAYRHSALLDVMAGWGRTRDATGVYEARILEERLREAGVIARALSPEARRRLAALMMVRSEYSTVRERPSKDLWAQVVRILRDDGALGEAGLGARAALRAAEVYLGKGITPDGLPRSPIPRLVGSFVGPSLAVRSTQTLMRSDASSFSQQTVNGAPSPPLTSEANSRSRVSSDEVLGGLWAEHHRALGTRWQLDATGRVAAQLRSQDDGFEGGASGRVSWMVSDRWVADASGSYNRRVKQGAGSGATFEDSWTTSLATGVSWFVEDRLLLTVSLQETQYRGYYFSAGHQRSGSIALGLTYRLLGAFQAPDLELGGPVR